MTDSIDRSSEEVYVNDTMIDEFMSKYGYEYYEPDNEYRNGEMIVAGDFASEMTKMQALYTSPEQSSKKHEHSFKVSQCEEGCGCNYLFVRCTDNDCDIDCYLSDGWENCNVDWQFWIQEDPEHLKALTNTHEQ